MIHRLKARGLRIPIYGDSKSKFQVRTTSGARTKFPSSGKPGCIPVSTLISRNGTLMAVKRGPCPFHLKPVIPGQSQLLPENQMDKCDSIPPGACIKETLIYPVFRHSREGGTKARSALNARGAARRVSAANNP